MKVIIVGAGGHGAVVADLLHAMRRAGADLELLGFVDDGASEGAMAHGLRVLGGVAHLGTVAHDAIVVAVGDNRARGRIFDAARHAGERFITAIHPSAVIAADASIGNGSMVCAGAIINPGTIIGPNVIVNTAASLDHHNVVGAHVHVAPGVHTGGEVRIGEGALVGIGAVITPRRQVGAWATVGAGAVVVRDVKADDLVVGVPAVPVRRPIT
ncbi:MAG: acetyltransferase [Acidobacteriaceae bacterium]|nr:acetyltransferase [Acidobacteriaceae bacterium]